MKQQIIRSSFIEKDLAQILDELDYDGLFLLTEENTHKLCFPLIEKLPEIRSARKCCIASGDKHKNLETLSSVWKFLTENGANRKSLMINLGGGMVTDLGGFAAATFKRGIRFINIPTTLLGAVDAAVGGKTGINFNGLKNEIGAFAPAIAVLIHSSFFKTLDHANLLSGYAEMLKHALLMPHSTETPSILSLLQFDLENPDYQKLNDLLFESIIVKERIVEEDPTEQGIRKALNLGHTFGHAFESLSYELNRPVLHGYAVAWGIICELYLSFIKLGFEKGMLMNLTHFIKENYGSFHFDCMHYQRLYELMRHDKKNEHATVNFTLLKSIGEVAINQTAGQKEIDEALDFFNHGEGFF
jgi:3-dehydroquinate synthase